LIADSHDQAHFLKWRSSRTADERDEIASPHRVPQPEGHTLPHPFIGAGCASQQILAADDRFGSCVTSIASPTAVRNCTRDEGRSFEIGSQVLVSNHCMAAVEKRLREELAELQVEINEEKSRNVDLGRGESFGFLGFDFRRMRSRRGVWRVNYTPKLKKRTALLRKLKDVFRRYQSQPVDRVVKLINPILRGWVNYFAVGHSSECFSFIQDWVEKKVRRHMGRAQNRKGFGWKRWSRQWLYETLRLFNGYRVRRPTSKVAPTG